MIGRTSSRLSKSTLLLACVGIQVSLGGRVSALCSCRPEFELRRVKFMFATGPAVNKHPPSSHNAFPCDVWKRTELAVQT